MKNKLLCKNVKNLLLQHLHEIGIDRLEGLSDRELIIIYQEIYLRSKENEKNL